MEHDEAAELLGAFALDALDDAVERAEVARHVRGCVKCRAELDDHLLVAAALAGGGGDAPADVWPAIIASLGSERAPALRLVVDRAPDGRRRRRRAGARAGVFAVAAAIVVWLAVVGGLPSGSGSGSARPAGGDDAAELARAACVADRDPTSVHVSLASANGALDARAVVLPDGRGFLLASNLPALPATRTYQLWALVGTSKVSVGVLGRSVRLRAFAVDPRSWGLAITEERAGGAVLASTPPVVVGRLRTT